MLSSIERASYLVGADVFGQDSLLNCPLCHIELFWSTGEVSITQRQAAEKPVPSARRVLQSPEHSRVSSWLLAAG